MSRFARIYTMGMFDGDECPICGGVNTVYSNHLKEWYCYTCGHEWD